jgi:hypothetical protein
MNAPLSLKTLRSLYAEYRSDLADVAKKLRPLYRRMRLAGRTWK